MGAVVVDAGHGPQGGGLGHRIHHAGGGLDHSAKDRDVVVELLVGRMQVSSCSASAAGTETCVLLERWKLLDDEEAGRKPMKDKHSLRVK